MLVVAGCGRCEGPIATLEDGPARGPGPTHGSWGGFEVEVVPGWDGPVVYGDPARSTIADVNGPGIALLDADSDGDLDLYIAQGSTIARIAAGRPGAPDRFFLNDGRGIFTEATQAWGLDQRCWSQGLAAGDIDGDGDIDLFVACLDADLILRNDGQRWTSTPLPGRAAQQWSASAAFGDLDGDGDLDLYVTRYLRFDWRDLPAPSAAVLCRWKGVRVSCGPKGLTPLADVLWINDGRGTFRPTTPPGGAGYGLGVLWLGDTIVVANDSSPNFLLARQTGGGLRQIGLIAGISRSGDGQEQAGMGIASGRLTPGTGPDLVMTHFADDHHTLYERVGDRAYRDRTFAAGLGEETLPALGWGVGAYDFDLDGDEDLLFVHGHVYPQADRADPDVGYAQRDQVWLQGPVGKFTEVGAERGLTERHVGRAAAFGDIDGDGDVDVVVVRLDGPPTIYRNRGGSGGHWLRFRLVPAIPGAVVTLEVGQSRTWIGGGSFQAASDPRLHFGLGKHSTAVGWTARWPDGRTASGRTEVDRDVVVSAPSPS